MYAQKAPISAKNPTMRLALDQARDQQTKTKSALVRDVIYSMLAKTHDAKMHVAPGLAKRFFEEANFAGQRDLKQWRVNNHVERIRSNTWDDGHAISFVEFPNGEIWMVNGQHRMKAIIETDIGVKVTVAIHHVQNEDQARRVYASFDRSESVRTTVEILDSVQVPNKYGLGKEYSSKVYNAMGYLINNLEPPRNHVANSVDNRIDQIEEWAEEARKFFVDTKGMPNRLRRRLFTAGSLAVALLTYRHQPEKAQNFWRGIAENDGLRKGDPRHTLLTDMNNRVLTGGSARQTVQAPSLAWNAFFTGRELKIVKCIEGAPIVVLGTPYSKGNQ